MTTGVDIGAATLVILGGVAMVIRGGVLCGDCLIEGLVNVPGSVGGGVWCCCVARRLSSMLSP